MDRTLPLTLGSGRLLAEIAPWLVLLLAAVIVGAVALAAARRFARRTDDTPEPGFTLQGLRDMHARGDLSDEEFARSRDALVARIRSPTSGNPGAVDPDNRLDAGR